MYEYIYKRMGIRCLALMHVYNISLAARESGKPRNEFNWSRPQYVDLIYICNVYMLRYNFM